MTSPRRDVVLPTALGELTLSWSDHGLTRIGLPSHIRVSSVRTSGADGAPDGLSVGTSDAGDLGDAGGTSDRVPSFVETAAAALRSYCAGGRVDLESIPIDVSAVSPYAAQVYRQLRRVLPGETVTYGELARAVAGGGNARAVGGAGAGGGARAVGRALASNPLPLVVPCHRVVAASAPGGFSGGQGMAAKLELLALEGVWLSGRLLGLAYEPRTAAEELSRRDPRLGMSIDRYGPYRLATATATATRREPYAHLVSSVIHQQLHGAAAGAILRRLQAELGGGATPPARLLASVTDDRFTAIGVSRPKAKALRAVAQAALDGGLPTARRAAGMSDEEIVDRLVGIHGVGRWTAQMYLLFGLGRPDVLPGDDYGVRIGLARLYGLDETPRASQAQDLARRWVPWRSVATWYLWRIAEEGRA